MESDVEPAKGYTVSLALLWLETEIGSECDTYKAIFSGGWLWIQMTATKVKSGLSKVDEIIGKITVNHGPRDTQFDSSGSKEISPITKS